MPVLSSVTTYGAASETSGSTAMSVGERLVRWQKAARPTLARLVSMQRFEGRHVVVTGAGRGIGKAIALRLAFEGARLSALARGADALHTTVQEIGGGFVAQCDVRDASQVELAFAAAAEANGPIHALVANSGIGGPNEPGSDDRFYDLVATNLIGTYQCVRSAQTRFADAAERRDIVVISSILARIAVPGYTVTAHRRRGCSASSARSPPSSRPTTCRSTRSAPAGSTPTWRGRASTCSPRRSAPRESRPTSRR